ncbi:hypothetical protein F0P94_10620 [Adhaeribacter soli]|uniref:Capsule assembly Wzi family protein n=1 Tax=Adhaeribacter soli TaxID=2607655 RepID=A0A5N1IUZ6_9BACT|nr:hypothetical protein F0P94_10620 [Adhaeribacter soli]
MELGTRTLGFFKDNEYFNKIADGYTLFGYQLQPSLKYYASEKIKLEAGVLLLKDFGNRKYRLIQPTFTAIYSTGKHTFLFGTLHGNLNFGYIEPLWDFERQLTTPIQNGIQYKYDGNRFDFQTWVDWQVMQYAYDPKQEEIAGGFTGNLKGFFFKRTQLSFPLQFTAKHKGGQIDVNDHPLTTLFNGATGFEITSHLSNWNDSLQQESFLRNIYTKNYFVGYKDHSFTHQFPFQGGSGIYLNAGADTRWANFMLSYWKGNGYISEFGGRLYQSVSTTVKNPGYIEKHRQLLILRIMKDWPILNADKTEYSGLTFTGRLEPFYDFRTGSVEFAAGLYLNFNTDFFLGKPKLRSR